nr:hypothetical protein GCM10020092_078720 [Actinoplanes digitatis]
MQPRTVLAVLAELAPAAAERILDVTRGSQPMVWLEIAEKAPREKTVERLAALDALHREERILHRGWGFLAEPRRDRGQASQDPVAAAQPAGAPGALTARLPGRPGRRRRGDPAGRRP